MSRRSDANKKLAQALWDADLAAVRAALEEGADPNDPKTTPVAEAAYFGHARILDLLLEAGGDPDQRSEHGVPAILGAVRSNKPTTFRRLVDRADLQSVDRLLHVAAANGNPKILEPLIERGFDVNARIEGNTPLHLAARCSKGKSVPVLLGAGADPMALDADGLPPLTIAAGESHKRFAPEVVRLLVEAGVEIDHFRPGDGRTALVAAFYDGAPESLQILLEAGADRRCLAEAGASLVDLAKKHKLKSSMAILEGLDASLTTVPRENASPSGPIFDPEAVLDTLAPEDDLTAAIEAKDVGRARAAIEAGALKDEDVVRTLLALAAGRGGLAVFDLILEAGVNMEAAGYEALSTATIYGRKRVAERLVAAGADPLGRDPVSDYDLVHTAAVHGQHRMIEYFHSLGVVATGGALHTAVRLGRKNAVRALLDAGADLESLDDNELPPLTVAAGEDGVSAIEIVKLLLAAGADPNHVRASDRYSALAAAIFKGQPETVLHLLGAGADPERLVSRDETLVEFARRVRPSLVPMLETISDDQP